MHSVCIEHQNTFDFYSDIGMVRLLSYERNGISRATAPPRKRCSPKREHIQEVRLASPKGSPRGSLLLWFAYWLVGLDVVQNYK